MSSKPTEELPLVSAALADLVHIAQSAGGGVFNSRATTIASILALVIDTAPGALDTLNELAAALGDDANFAATITIALASKQGLDADLSAIAALATTDYGRAFLELANQAALVALFPTPLKTHVIQLQVTDPAGAALATGDGKAYYSIPSTLNGCDLVAVELALTTVSSSGIPTFQIANVTDGVDMLSTKLTVDASELHSMNASAPAVIDATKDDVVTGDLLRIDCDVAGTGAKGAIINLHFRQP